MVKALTNMEREAMHSNHSGPALDAYCEGEYGRKSLRSATGRLEVGARL